MTLPSAEAVLSTLEATWPPAETNDLKPFTLRRGEGGGKRVSAASAHGTGSATFADAEAAMRAMDQTPTFRLLEGDEALDDALSGMGYTIVDPTLLMAYTGPPPKIDRVRAGLSPDIEELWAEGGIGPGRLAVMKRVAGPKSVLSEPNGVVFVAIGAGGAMLHALHVDPAHRQTGIGRRLVQASIRWAFDHAAPWLSLAVTEANSPAIKLYTSLGFHPVGRYWYRMRG